MSTSEEKSIQLVESPSNEIEDNPLAHMPTKMQRFIHLYMTGQYTLAKLSQLLELHPNTLGKWLKRKDVKEAIAEMQSVTHDAVSIQLRNATLKAVEKLNKLMDSPIDGVALQAVKDVLDRAGHKQKTEIKIDKTVTTIEQKMKDLINSTIIDVDFEEVDNE